MSLKVFDVEVMIDLIQKFDYPILMGMNAIGKGINCPGQIAVWDEVHLSRNMSPLTVPGGEAVYSNLTKKVARSAQMAYTRVKKSLDAKTMYWVREAGNKGAAVAQAENAVVREMKDLDFQVAQRTEWMIWETFKGGFTYNSDDVKVVVDFGLPAANKPTAVPLWTDTANSDPLANIRAWVQQIMKAGGKKPTNLYINGETLTLLMQNDKIRDSLKAVFGQGTLTSRIKELILVDTGLAVVEQSSGYVPIGGTFTYFLPAANVILSSGFDAIDLLNGNSLDHKAMGRPGKFAKSWEQEDPSTKILLVEHYRLPVLRNVEEVVYATVG